MWKSAGKALSIALQAHAAGAVTYTRGAYTVTLRAAPGRTLYERETAAGIIETVESKDFLFSTADLILNGSQALPQRGDKLTESDTDTGKIYTYEVTGPGTEAVYRFADPTRSVIRLHTKQVNVSDA